MVQHNSSGVDAAVHLKLKEKSHIKTYQHKEWRGRSAKLQKVILQEREPHVITHMNDRQDKQGSQSAEVSGCELSMHERETCCICAEINCIIPTAKTGLYTSI